MAEQSEGRLVSRFWCDPDDGVKGWCTCVPGRDLDGSELGECAYCEAHREEDDRQQWLAAHQDLDAQV